MGFTEYALVDQKKIGGLEAARPASEGLDIDYTFRIGQSGPFGRDLDVEWLTIADMNRRCRGFISRFRIAKAIDVALRPLRLGKLSEAIRNRLLPETTTWYDIHARRALRQV
jgi:hypothetical protein